MVFFGGGAALRNCIPRASGADGDCAPFVSFAPFVLLPRTRWVGEVTPFKTVASDFFLDDVDTADLEVPVFAAFELPATERRASPVAAAAAARAKGSSERSAPQTKHSCRRG